MRLAVNTVGRVSYWTLARMGHIIMIRPMAIAADITDRTVRVSQKVPATILLYSLTRRDTIKSGCIEGFPDVWSIFSDYQTDDHGEKNERREQSVNNAELLE